MEPRFGHDFSQVRVHDDERASESASDVHALAYTVGPHIVFGRQQYAPETAAGRRLLAHELAHTVQQGAVTKAGSTLSRAVAEPLGTLHAVVQREDKKETPGVAECGSPEVFTELDLRIPFTPNKYFNNGKSVDEKTFNADLASAQKGACDVTSDFTSIALKWDLGNPKLGTWYLRDVNQGSHSVNLKNHLIYKGATCCSCFQGAVGWSFGIEAERTFDKGKATEHKETGKTASPIAGSKTSENCKGDACCSFYKSVNLTYKQPLGNEISINFIGNIVLRGTMYQPKT
jgi:hypothetical protein